MAPDVTADLDGELVSREGPISKLFDALTRSLLEKYPADWLNQLGLIHVEPVRVMNSDLSSVTAEADKVIRVEGPQPWLVHIELQAGYDRTLPGDSYGTMRC